MKFLMAKFATVASNNGERTQDQAACACPPQHAGTGIALDAYSTGELPAAFLAFLESAEYAYLHFVTWGGTQIDLDAVRELADDTLDYTKLMTCIAERGDRIDEAILLIFFALSTDKFFTVPSGLIPRLHQRRFKLPEFVWAVESKAFGECSSVAEIVLPKECERLDPAAFVGCTRLERGTLSGVGLLPDEGGTPFHGAPKGFTISLSLGVDFGVPVKWEHKDKKRG